MSAISKTEFRKKIRNELSQAIQNGTLNIGIESHRICQNIINSDIYRQSEVIFSYMALSDEVNLMEVMQNALDNHKILLLPKCNDSTLNYNNGCMGFFRIENLDCTEPGGLGVMEPVISESFADQTKQYTNNSILYLIPGRGFTRDGWRIGRGKGFYDKYFAAHFPERKKNRVHLAGVCFPQQITAELPVDAHDFPLDSVYF